VNGTQPQATRLEIELEIPQPDGTVQQDIPYGEAIVGDLLGDAEHAYGDDLLQVTPQNLNQLVNLVPKLRGLDIRYEVFGQVFTDTIAELTFDTHPDRWVEAVVQQDRELQAIDALLRLVEEARKNPFLKRELTLWLKQYLAGNSNTN
jgi:hypothetical protein